MKATLTPLRSILTQRQGETVENNGTYPIAGVYGFGRGVLLREPLRGFETKYTALTQLREGDVVYSKLKAFEAAITIVDAPADGYYVSQEFPVFSVSSAVNARYLDHMLKSSAFLKALAALSTGIGARRERVHPDQFLRLEVPIPSRPDQDRIAAHLDSLGIAAHVAPTTNLDAAIERLILEAASDAPRVRLSSILARDREWIELDTDTIYKPVGVSSFGKGMIRYSETNSSGLSKMRYYYLRPGDLLVSNVMAWQGAVCVVEETDAGRVANNRFLQYRPTGDTASTGWLALFFGTTEGTAMLANASHMHSPTNHTLSLNAFDDLEVPVPERVLQDRIMTIARQADAVRTSVGKRNELAKAILPAARNEIFNDLATRPRGGNS
ncbi:MAG: restriction endonuclease subunit S [Propionibacteriaceae bacterium]|nr:restriction endonuclease subunit S [Propionibacteriaceae bacterium]